MALPLPPGDAAVLSDRDRIDRIREEFERKWRSGEHPRIEDFLYDTQEPLRSTLLIELVKLDVECRRRIGEDPSVDDYAQRFPQYAGQLLGSWEPDPDKTALYRKAAGAFAHFELREFLGRGSYGDVWMAFDQRLQRIVALKLPRQEALDGQATEVFRREARAAAQLRHPNIVRLYEVGEEGDTTYIVAEYIEGINLKDLLHSKKPGLLPPRESAQLAAKMAEALQHAHACGVIHRDLKPANVLIDRQGEPHIADFGLAKRTNIEASLTGEGLRLGTVPYMSPEQAAGTSHRVDGRSDVFGLGVILYEMLTGRRPFRGEEHVVIHRILTEDPEPPSRARGEIPRDLESICLKALEKDPQRRYQSAGELAADLRRFLEGEPVHARPVRFVERLVRRIRRSPGPSLAVATSALCLAAAVVLALYGLKGSAVAEPPRRVRVVTEPAGATVVLVPISRTDGKPRADQLVRAGTSPVELELAPGDYWVVADLPGRGFHEVRRRVPGPDEDSSNYFAHQSWTESGGVLILRAVEIPRSSVIQGMARLEGRDDFRAGGAGDPPAPPAVRRVAGFYLDPTEFTAGAYRALHRGQLPRAMRDRQVDDGEPVFGLSWDEAAFLAEVMGKRLPDEWEYEFAATAGGRSPFPWGHSAEPFQTWDGGLGNVGVPPWDRLSSVDAAGDPVFVYGLCTGVAEWTDSCPDAALMWRHPTVAEFDMHYHSRVIRGGSAQVVDGQSVADPAAHNPRLRHALARMTSGMRGLGFRCARSAKPRLAREDWEERPGTSATASVE